MTNVPMYAYAFGLLVFGAPLTSARLSKKSFFDSLGKDTAQLCPFFYKFQFVALFESLPLMREVARSAGGRDKNVANTTEME